MNVFPDANGIVRNVEVGYKLHDLDDPKTYKGQPYSIVKRAIQRLVVVMQAGTAQNVDD